MTVLSVRAAPIVPDRGPEPPSSRAWIEAHRRRVAADRVRPSNRVAAAEIESQAGQLQRHWLESGRISARNAAARRREAEIQRQVAEELQLEDFAAKRAAVHLAQDRARFMAARAQARSVLVPR